MSITIKEIARLAGVSRGTVDRALHKRGHVNPDVEKRIFDIAQQYNYQPNLVGKALAKSRDPLILGAIINDHDNPFFDYVWQGIHAYESEASGLGFELIPVHLKNYDPQIQYDALLQLEQSGIDGIIITAINHPMISQKINELTDQKIAIVTCNMDIEHTKRLCYVGCDYEKSGHTAGELLGLITNGCANIGVISGAHSIWGHHMRLNGFLHELAENWPLLNVLSTIDGQDDNDLTYQATKQMLQNPALDSLCFLTAGLEGAMRAIHELNFSYSKRIIAFDQTPINRQLLLENKIAAIINQQPYQQGYMSLKILFEYLNTNQKPASLHHLPLDIKTKTCF